MPIVPLKWDKYTIKILYNIGNWQKQKKATKYGDYMAELEKKIRSKCIYVFIHRHGVFISTLKNIEEEYKN